jgi:hypothetical protein
MPVVVIWSMKKLVGFALIFAVYGCAKLMEDQPATADSTQVNDTLHLETASTKTPRVPERFLKFYSHEFKGSVGATGGSDQTLDVETIMDVSIELQSEAEGMTFIIRKDGLDITEEPAAKWEGRLVPGKYRIAVIPAPHSAQSAAYSLVVKEN